jgi:lipopolysaccharide/colanic/teichoic acid biosynthesis glycosyltransferase
MLVISGIIKLCSSGPVLFRQERIGFKGKPFICLKFRTMHVQAETVSHQAHLEKLINSSTPMKKLDADGDRRIFRFGRLLRASGLDELPQLLNVLQGEMSLVGPRPCIRYEYERFKPEHRERFNTAPGLTGLWQVSGKNKTTFQEMIDLDIAYARHLSLLRDIRILCRTFPVIFEQTFELAQPKVSRNGRPVRLLQNQSAN